MCYTCIQPVKLQYNLQTLRVYTLSDTQLYKYLAEGTRQQFMQQF